MSFDPTPVVSCKYGAPMGRASHNDFTVAEQAGPFRLVRCPLDSGGYDRGGAYWGLGEPLYYYEGPLTDINGYVRGSSRERAKDQVRLIHPFARFYR